MSSSSASEYSWIQWFCNTRGNEFFITVDEDYIADQFNLTGLTDVVSNFKAAWKKILDEDNEGSEADSQETAEIEQCAEKLYGLIHARYILTNNGLRSMYNKIENKEFGTCPRVFCRDAAVIPTGLYDDTGIETVKLFCPCCEEVYQPKHLRHKALDGAFFGTSFVQMLMMAYPALRRRKPPIPFVPKLYGFAIHPKAYDL